MELLQIGLFWTLLVGALATVLVVGVVAGGVSYNRLERIAIDMSTDEESLSRAEEGFLGCEPQPVVVDENRVVIDEDLDPTDRLVLEEGVDDQGVLGEGGLGDDPEELVDGERPDVVGVDLARGVEFDRGRGRAPGE